MLKTMRNNIQSLKPILWIIVGTFILSIFVVWGGAGRLGEGGRAGTLVAVGREPTVIFDHEAHTAPFAFTGKTGFQRRR